MTQVAYGAGFPLSQFSPLQSTLALSHGVILTGLSPSTTYYFVAQSADATGATGISTTYSFTTLFSGGPVISGINAVPSGGNKASINWTTSTPANSYVQAGTASGVYTFYSNRTALTTTPQCTLGYVPSGVIHYQLVSVDASGNQTLSADMTFVEP